MRIGRRRLSKSKIAAACVIIITAAAVFTFCGMEKRIEPKIKELCTYYCESRLCELLTKSVSESVRESGLKYSDIAVRNETGGRLSSIEIRTEKINMLQSEIVSRANRYLSDYSKKEISVPVGSMSGSYLLSGRGFDVRVRFVMDGSVRIKLKNEFRSGGINQTSHSITAEVTAEGVMILPSGNTRVSAEVSCPVSESIIIGDVPKGLIKNGL